MDPVKNPYAPGAGTPPPELTGREEILEKARIALIRVKENRPAKSLLLVGLRGVGKTVLLNEIHEIALSNGYEAELTEVSEHKKLVDLLIPSLRKILLKLDRGKNVSEKVKRALRVLASFSISVSYGDLKLDFGGFSPEQGAADSGNLEQDLLDLFVAIGEAAEVRHTPVALIIDELQYLNDEELSALITAMHRVVQRQLPFILVGAGLPQLVGKAGNAKSYAERLFEFPEIGPLSQDDAARAIAEPAGRQNITFEPSALKKIYDLTKGYPYFLQEWGFHAWNKALTSPVNPQVIDEATVIAIKRLDESFFRVRYDRLTPSEKRYMRAMAELGPGPHRSGAIAEKMGVDVKKMGPIRASLIKKGMIYSPQHGDTAFTVPLFDQFMCRIMPELNHTS